MQKLSIYILTILLLNACSKNFLETKIDTLETDKTINSDYSTLLSLGNAPYAFILNGFTVLDANLFAAATDEAEATAAFSFAQMFNQGSWNATTNPDNNYAQYYSGIRAANYFLEHSVNYRVLLGTNRDTISAAGRISYNNDVANVAWYRGEAHLLRAYFYFELAKRYGGVPLVTKVLTANDNTNLPATPYDSIIHFIVNEIDTWKDSLQVNWKTSAFSNYDGRFTKGAALTLKAQALLQAASPLHSTDNSGWAAAAAAAHEVIALGIYGLDTSYRSYFLLNNPLSSNETILALRQNASNYMERNNYPISTSGGASGLTPSHNLVADYEYTGAPDPANPYANRDPRLQASIVTNGSNWNGRTIDESPGGIDDMANTNASKTGYYLKKFLNDNMNLVQGQMAVHHWVIMRYAELLLTFAEAMNEAYGPDNTNGFTLSARAALNMVRARPGVNMPAVTAVSQNEFRDAVKHERRIELAFEDYRYWDLVRWRDAGAVMNMPLLGMNMGNVMVVEERKFDASKMYYYPFPQAEISISKGVLKQNPGW